MQVCRRIRPTSISTPIFGSPSPTLSFLYPHGAHLFSTYQPRQRQETKKRRSAPSSTPQRSSAKLLYPENTVLHKSDGSIASPSSREDKFLGPLDDESMLIRLRKAVQAWCQSKERDQELKLFGLQHYSIISLLRMFSVVAQGELDDALKLEGGGDYAKIWYLHEMRPALRENLWKGVNKTLLNRFLDWAIEYSSKHREPAFSSLEGAAFTPLPFAELQTLIRIRETTNMLRPGFAYVGARGMKRKLILHVGPTNSGKTYNALRALVQARSGVYCGPLRLLAHEVWERINDGSLIKPTPPNRAFDVLDSADALPAVKNASHSSSADLYSNEGRPCNLVTGEERRTVDAHASLISCTIEMLPVSPFFDVAVIDEIQMIADPERGGAWTRALLGTTAREVHLCGEPTVVNLIKRIAEELGDELVINEYERLAPLQTSPGLHGNYANIQKGDCVVAFSRTKIFEIKAHIEKLTGLRCAVAYGRLPPEVRSEQAALFNDPDSGYDVLVASDAIGMGLNLKIKRIIFSTLAKFNGIALEPLSISQVKQIAGRAGRYSLPQSPHDAPPPGFVTTLHDDQLPALNKYMAAKLPEVQHAIVDPTQSTLNVLLSTSGSLGTYERVFKILEIAMLPGANYQPRLIRQEFMEATKNIDRFIQQSAQGVMPEALHFLYSPVQWKDENSVKAFQAMLEQFNKSMTVSVDFLLNQIGANVTMSLAAAARRMDDERQAKDPSGSAPENTPPDRQKTEMAKINRLSPAERAERAEMLDDLEPIHRLICLYLWLSYRLPLAFGDQARAFELKDEVEQHIDYVLSTLRNVSTQASIMQAKSLEDLKNGGQQNFSWDYDRTAPIRHTAYRATDMHLPF